MCVCVVGRDATADFLLSMVMCIEITEGSEGVSRPTGMETSQKCVSTFVDEKKKKKAWELRLVSISWW